MEVSMELEDDVFFADLSKQISLLIMDDDETSANHCPSVSLEVMQPRIHMHSSSFMYEQMSMSRRESKGTGVFIPRSSHPRRKNRHAKFSSKSQRPSDNSGQLTNSPQTNFYINNPTHSINSSTFP